MAWLLFLFFSFAFSFREQKNLVSLCNGHCLSGWSWQRKFDLRFFSWRLWKQVLWNITWWYPPLGFTLSYHFGVTWTEFWSHRGVGEVKLPAFLSTVFSDQVLTLYSCYVHGKPCAKCFLLLLCAFNHFPATGSVVLVPDPSENWSRRSCFLIMFESPWYDLRGWLGVKNQLSIYLVLKRDLVNQERSFLEICSTWNSMKSQNSIWMSYMI